MSDREPPRRRVPGPGPAKPPRPRGAVRRQPGPGARPVRRSGGARPPVSRPLRLGSPRPRLRLVSLALTLVLLAFVVRLLQVQAVDASSYTARAEQNRYVVHTLAAERGEITDRNGVALAVSEDAYDITADPTMFGRAQLKISDGPEKAAALLAPILGQDQAALVRKLRPANKNSRYTRLAARQTPQVWKQIKDLKTALTTKSETDHTTVNVLAGVFADPSSQRVYPNGDLAAGILGWVNADGQGGGGIEQELDKQLSGKDGKVRYAQAGGRQVPTAGSTETPAVPGSDVELTIDRDIQWAAQDAISEQVRKSKADRGYVIVQDTRTGQILAMANSPGFDPNDLSKADGDAMGNAAVQDAYEPGSTAKVMSMAAVLERNVATPLTHVVVPNRLHRGDRLFQDVQVGPMDSTFTVLGPNGERVHAKSPLPGPFNVANTLAAVVALAAAGLDPQTAADGIAAVPGVPGRLERVDAGQPYLAVVDYAHKTDAVESVLKALRKVTKGRLHVVLGCGGDRDRTKRAPMGAAVARLADTAVLTSDNPRSEDPLAILATMLQGAASVPAHERGEVLLFEDRASAVAAAVGRAQAGDTVLVAGKGHEQGQDIAGVVRPFDDRQVLREAIQKTQG
ncbi:glutamate ligase domain-containing protein [Streptomyces canarius]